jgi:hypothetical protein
MLADSVAEDNVNWTEAEKAAVSQQVERLLASPYFNHSKRFPTFLRFVVQHALAGQTDLLKERTLGVEIFGRNPDYDTATDPIVRVTAAEIRKRIAQFYLESGRDEDIRISLPAGSYVPQFQFPDLAREACSDENAIAIEIQSPIPPEISVKESESFRLPRRYLMVLRVIFAMAIIAVVAVWEAMHRSPFDFFWGPVLKSPDPILFCIADQNQYSEISLRDASDPSHQTLLKDNLSAVVMDDLSAIVKLAGLMQARGKKYTLKGEGTTELMDLRSNPTIFVGAFDNAWTLRLSRTLRFHFGNNPEMSKFWIADANNSKSPVWVVDRNQQEATNNYRDYAIVARFVDPDTGKLAIIAAGVGRGGTIVAGEFLTDPSNLDELEKVARKAGSGRNMEIVLSTQIIDGQPGTPKIEATYFW